LQAAEELSGKKEALSKLKDALDHDGFYGVRLAAAQSIRALATDEALDALIASTQQSDARVRREVVAAIGGFYREASYAAALRILKEEKNPDIQGAAVTSLGAYAKPDVRDIMLQFLNSTSFHSYLADAAIGGIRAQDDAAYIAPLLETMHRQEAVFTTGVFSRGLETLGWLGRNQEQKESVREFLLAQLLSHKKRTQLSAIGALGALGDAKAIPALEKLTGGPKGTPERVAAERAVTSLRDTRKPSAEVSILRNDVLTLQRENRDLRKDLDEIKKKFDALASRSADTKSAKSASPNRPRKQP
jgi:aminopeptidase N